MFNSYEFTFAGESCLMYGLKIYEIDGRGQSDAAFGNRGSVVETRTNRRVQPIHFGVKYNEKPLSFKLVFGAERPLDRYELEDISFWLTGHQTYQWLSIAQPDLEDVQFKCLITELTPISVGWLQYAFEATVVCDCPYAYGYPFRKKYEIKGETKILFRNESLVREYFRPVLVFEPNSGTKSLSIVNLSDDNREFRLDNLSPGERVVIDNNNRLIYEKNFGRNLYGGFNLNFFRMGHGDNNLVVNGDGVLTISGRFYHNIAA